MFSYCVRALPAPPARSSLFRDPSFPTLSRRSSYRGKVLVSNPRLRRLSLSSARSSRATREAREQPREASTNDVYMLLLMLGFFCFFFFRSQKSLETHETLRLEAAPGPLSSVIARNAAGASFRFAVNLRRSRRAPGKAETLKERTARLAETLKSELPESFARIKEPRLARPGCL